MNSYENNEKRNYPTVYSNMRMSNQEGLDPSRLSFSFTLNGLLKLTITPIKGTNENGFAQYDTDNEAVAFISYTKAKMLEKEIRNYLSTGTFSTGQSAFAINTKHGLVQIYDGKVEGVDGPLLAIIETNPNTGKVDAKYIYQFKRDYHYIITNYDESNGNFDTNNYPDIEIEIFADLLEQYYLSCSNAIAYSVINSNRYNQERLNNDLDALKAKAGISTGGNSYRGGGNYFNRNNGNVPPVNQTQNSYQDLESKINSMEED